MKHYAQPVRKTLAILLLACIFFSSFGGTLSVLAEEITFLGETMLAGLSNSGYYYSGGNGYQTGGNGYWTGNNGYQTGSDGYWTGNDGYQTGGNGYWTPGTIAYSVSNGEATVTGYAGNALHIVIPDTFESFPVTAIGWDAFAANTSLSSVIIPDSVASIGYGAFYGCTNLTSVTIGNGVTTIEPLAFRNCHELSVLSMGNSLINIGWLSFGGCSSLTSVIIPDSVTTIGVSAFVECTSLSSLTIGNNVSVIDDNAFADCVNLTSVIIPDSVTVIGESAFDSCTSLLKINVSEGNANYRSEDGVLLDREKSTLIQFPDGKSGDYIIPDSVTTIGAQAFAGCVNLTSVIIPGSVTTIDHSAFYDCTNLISIIIPDSVVIIDNLAFCYCNSLTDVYYTGTTEQANSINIGGENEELLNANWHYNYVPPCDIHSWNDASCTEPATCTICGATEGAALGHIYSVVITVPDCTNDGYTTYTCTACGDSYTNHKAAALGHSWMEATCTAPKTCAVCSATEGDALGHSYNAVITEPDCTNGGYTTNTCIVCGGSYINNKVDALGHSWVDATCTSPKTCDVCGEVEGNALGHNWNAATCTTPKTCMACQETEGETLGHNYDNNCDAVCNVIDCGYTRSVSDHVFNNACDTDCNICGETRQAGDHVWVGGACDICGVASPSQVTIISESATASYAKMGAKVSAKVTAEGKGLTYTWYIKNEGGSKYSKSSVTSATYSTTMSAKAKNRRVYCVVADQYGNTVQSKTFLLRESVSITKEPATAAYAKKGAKASLKVSASGDSLKYTWYFRNDGKKTYSKSSVTSSTYSVTMGSKVKGRRVYCIVKDKYGKTVQSKTFILREAVSITTQPKTVTVAKNKTAKITVKASGDGLKYTWYIKNSGSKKYTKSSVTKSSYSVKMTSKVKNRLVYCVVKDKYGKTVKSATVRLKMK